MGHAIPLGARIFAIADSLDAITSARPYHTGHSFEAAREEIRANSGAQFDPLLVEAFLTAPHTTWLEIRECSMREPAPHLDGETGALAAMVYNG